MEVEIKSLDVHMPKVGETIHIDGPQKDINAAGGMINYLDRYYPDWVSVDAFFYKRRR